MPELPEVEVLKLQITPILLGKKIISTVVRNGSLRKLTPLNIDQALQGEIIRGIIRRNKYLILETDGQWLIIHLGMTGQILLNNDTTPQKHDHIIVNFDQGNMRYRDPRRFGLFLAFSKQDYSHYEDILLFKNLGAEPLQVNFTASKFKKIIKETRPKQTMKAFLMDGSKVCGIGNIYASEILFQANIHPQSLIGSITHKQILLLRRLIVKQLNEAVAAGGSSISDYRHADGSKGHMQNSHRVYGRAGQPCVVCQTTITKIVQHGRSSYFCASCQK